MQIKTLALSSILIASTLLVLFPRDYLRHSIATVDKESIQGQFVRQLAEVGATPHQVAHSTQKFHTLFNQVLTETAAQKRLVILRKNDVVAGAIDITDDVRSRLGQAMRNAL